MLRTNTRIGSRRNISYHYDLGNDFYRLWLDPTMTYSSALFEREDVSLEEAQRAKYRRLVQLLDLEPRTVGPRDRLRLGRLRRHRRRREGLPRHRPHPLGAPARLRRAPRREAGLADRIDIRLEDYRDVEGRFDRVASTEMFEAVGERYWPLFFRAAARPARGRRNRRACR